MDHKPLLQERPPAYNLEAGQGDFACGPHGYGAIPAAPPPPPYPYLVTGGPRGAAGRPWGAGRAAGAEVAGRGEDPGGGPGRGRGRAERAGRGALGPACKLGASPMETFNPETNFTPDAAAAGRCPEADPVPGTRGPGVVARGEGSGAKLPHQEAGVGLLQLGATRAPSAHLGGVHARPALPRTQQNPVSNELY